MDMCLQNGKTRKVNYTLTNLIIKLHDRGYTEDFVTRRHEGRLALVSDNDRLISDFQISIINQFFDRLDLKFTYLHAIETNCGLRGIVLSNDVLFASNVQYVRMESTYKTETPIHSAIKQPLPSTLLNRL
ncbi:hypothetical protein [Mucilaginibacter lappiensis]|uniref:hypothetical protein n=1 Tax=Mucilaginibacter lappiensis TaxID=354630 RepID=UPI003D1976F7